MPCFQVAKKAADLAGEPTVRLRFDAVAAEILDQIGRQRGAIHCRNALEIYLRAAKLQLHVRKPVFGSIEIDEICLQRILLTFTHVQPAQIPVRRSPGAAFGRCLRARS